MKVNTPQQIAATVTAALTGVIALLGLAVTSFADGPLAVVGGWASAALIVLTPIAVFVKAAAPLIEDVLDGDDEVTAAA